MGNTSAAWRSRLGSVGLTLVLLTALTLTLPAAGSRAVAATTPVTVVNALGDGRPVVRLDTDGNPLDAHDGQLLVDAGRYWLIGMAYSCGQEWPGRRTPGVVSTTCGVRAYSSPDLVTWTNEGFLVDGSAMPSSPKLACTPACWRPKALHTRSGWVIWINSPARSTRNRLAPRQTLRVPVRGGHLLSVTAALCSKATTAADVVVDDVATFPLTYLTVPGPYAGLVPDIGVVWVDASSGVAEQAGPADLVGLLGRDDGWVWVDVPEPDESTARLLTERFGIHPKAATDALSRNHIARLHHYGEVLYLALHRPEPGSQGHVHYLELDLFVGSRFVVTLHGPRNPVVPLAAMVRETGEVADRMAAGRLRPRTPMALVYAHVAALTNVQERLVNDFAAEVGLLEQRVMASADDENPQEFLDELFTVRHTLLTVRTMASQGAQVMARAVTLMSNAPMGDRLLLEDLREQYDRLDQIAKSQLEFLEGVTAFYRARTDTRMTIAAERLAVIAAITLPVAAISGVFGMNLIVNDRTHWVELAVVVVAMSAMSLYLLRWAKRQGWW